MLKERSFTLNHIVDFISKDENIVDRIGRQMIIVLDNDTYPNIRYLTHNYKFEFVRVLKLDVASGSELLKYFPYPVSCQVLAQIKHRGKVIGYVINIFNRLGEVGGEVLLLIEDSKDAEDKEKQIGLSEYVKQKCDLIDSLLNSSVVNTDLLRYSPYFFQNESSRKAYNVTELEVSHVKNVDVQTNHLGYLCHQQFTMNPISGNSVSNYECYIDQIFTYRGVVVGVGVERRLVDEPDLTFAVFFVEDFVHEPLPVDPLFRAYLDDTERLYTIELTDDLSFGSKEDDVYFKLGKYMIALRKENDEFILRMCEETLGLGFIIPVGDGKYQIAIPSVHKPILENETDDTHDVDPTPQTTLNNSQKENTQMKTVDLEYNLTDVDAKSIGVTFLNVSDDEKMFISQLFETLQRVREAKHHQAIDLHRDLLNAQIEAICRFHAIRFHAK